MTQHTQPDTDTGTTSNANVNTDTDTDTFERVVFGKQEYGDLIRLLRTINKNLNERNTAYTINDPTSNTIPWFPYVTENTALKTGILALANDITTELEREPTTAELTATTQTTLTNNASEPVNTELPATASD